MNSQPNGDNMTTTPKQMTLEQVLDWHISKAAFYHDEQYPRMEHKHRQMADAIKSELAKEALELFSETNQCSVEPDGAELAKQRKPSETITLSEALRCLEDHALGAYTLQGDDVQRMQAVADKLAGRQRNAAEATDAEVTEACRKLLGDSYDILSGEALVDTRSNMRDILSAVASRDREDEIAELIKSAEKVLLGKMPFIYRRPDATEIVEIRVSRSVWNDFDKAIDAARQENKP